MSFFRFFKSSNEPTIGKDIKWSDVVGKVFQITEFDRNDTIIDIFDNVIAKSKFKPYGYLKVVSNEFEKTFRLPIVHRDDFLLAATVFDSPTLTKKLNILELLVTYVPEHKTKMALAGIHHALHYALVPNGTISKYYELTNDNHNEYFEKIFGQLVWSGQIKVNFNSDLILI